MRQDPTQPNPTRLNPTWSSLGVMRKYCLRLGPHELSTMRLNTCLSFLGSMPWLISSTTLNGLLWRSCKSKTKSKRASKR